MLKYLYISTILAFIFKNHVYQILFIIKIQFNRYIYFIWNRPKVKNTLSLDMYVMLSTVKV